MEYELTCYGEGKKSFVLPLSPYPSTESPLTWMEREQMPYEVYGDVGYKLALEGEYPLPVVGVSVYVNEEYIEGYLEGKVVSFPQIHGRPQCIFMDSFGFAALYLEVVLSDGTQMSLYAPPLSVLVREDAVSRSVGAMADYVFERHEKLLSLGSFSEKEFDGKLELEEHSLDSYLALAEEILISYETSFHYFKTNCRFRMEQVAQVDRMEKLQQVTPRTIAFMAQHPEYLKRVRGTQGVRLGGQVYLPEKTLVTQNVYSKDIYENRVVVYFLHSMLETLTKLQEKVEEFSLNLPKKEKEEEEREDAYPLMAKKDRWEKWTKKEEGEKEKEEEKRPEEKYVSSHHCILQKMTGVMEVGGEKLQGLYDRFLSMTLQYHKIMGFALGDYEYMDSTPKPTAVLLSVPQYHNIYVRMHQWFDSGLYDFGKERAMLSYLRISDLYEYFLLVKMVEYFQVSGWDQEPFVSFAPGGESGRNTQEAFLFRKGKEKVILYFRPKIYDSDHNHWNMTGLYRNNSLSLGSEGDKGRTGVYYEPDFVMKIETEEGEVRYVVMDGKFSGLYTVKQHYLLPLLYKYMISLSPISREEKIVGLGVFYGKCGDGDRQETLYNKQMDLVRPFTELIPLVQGVNDIGHFQLIRKLLEP